MLAPTTAIAKLRTVAWADLMLVGIDQSIKRHSVDQPFFDQQRFERLDCRVRSEGTVSWPRSCAWAMSPVVAAPLAVKEPLRVVFIQYSSPGFPANAEVAEKQHQRFMRNLLAALGGVNQGGSVQPKGVLAASEEQTKAVRHVLGSEDFVISCQGPTGAGKTGLICRKKYGRS
jgi:hypothetical protein